MSCRTKTKRCGLQDQDMTPVIPARCPCPQAPSPIRCSSIKPNCPSKPCCGNSKPSNSCPKSSCSAKKTGGSCPRSSCGSSSGSCPKPSCPKSSCGSSSGSCPKPYNSKANQPCKTSKFSFFGKNKKDTCGRKKCNTSCQQCGTKCPRCN